MKLKIASRTRRSNGKEKTMHIITNIVLLLGMVINSPSVTFTHGKEITPYSHDASKMNGMTTPATRSIFSLHKDEKSMPAVDPSLILIWFIAVFTIVMGGYFSIPFTTYNQTSGQISISKLIPLLVIMAVVLLLVLYFFYKYAVYFVITAFVIVTIYGNFECLCCTFNRFFPHVAEYRIPEHVIKSKPRISSIPILIISVCISISWVVLRKECNIWILQVFMAVCLCVTAIRQTFVFNLKTGYIFLTVMLVYDVFMVYVTPYFTANGRSVMEQVALGASAKERGVESIPIVIKIPNLFPGSSTVCGRSHSLLGLGDIIVPGFFVSFCHNFDYFNGSKWSVYFVTCCVGYGFGLLVALLVVTLTRSAQPALLYLCPSTLLGVTCVGLCRGEVKKLWKGINDENTGEASVKIDEMSPSLKK